MLWCHNARVNSHQRWKQTQIRVWFHFWCELTSTKNVWQILWNSWFSMIIYIYEWRKKCIFVFSGYVTCPGGFSLVHTFCYHSRLEIATFDEHNAYCTTKGGYMLKIGTEEENIYVAQTLSGDENFFLSRFVWQLN